MKKSIKQFILIGGGFSAGFFAGALYIAGKRPNDLDSLKHSLAQAENRINKTRSEVKARYVTYMNKLIEALKKKLSDPIPDLYEATDSIILSEDDIGYV